MKLALRLTAVILLLSMLAVLLPSCGKTETQKLTNVFSETPLQLPAEYAENENFNINELYSNGDTIYAYCYTWNNETYTSESFLLPIDAEGNVGEKISFQLDTSENSNQNVSSFCFASDGTIWAVINSYNYSETDGYQETYELRHYSNGSYETINLEGLTDEETGETFYINQMAIAPDDTLILMSWNGVKLMGSDGKLKDLDLGTDTSDYSINGMMTLQDKVYLQIYFYSTESSSEQLCEIDTVNCKLGETLEIQSNSSMYGMLFGPGYDYYYRDSSSVYGCTLGSDERVEVLNFINSDINSNNLNYILPLSPDKFVAVSYDTTTYMQELSVLNRIPDDQVAERQIITLAVPYLYYNLNEDIISFNKSNEQYRIVVTDYSQYNTNEDYSAGTTRLNNDLISGKIPDILMIDAEMNYDSYVSKGLFTDLYELMDADPNFNRADYLENVFKAYEIDGKLYSLVPTFNILTFAAKASNLEGIEHWTVDEFMEFAAAHPDMQMFDYDFNRENFLMMLMIFARDSFIDNETGECHFDSEEFMKMLEFTKTLESDDFWSSVNNGDVGEEFWQEYENRFVENRVLLAAYSMYDFENSYKSLINYTLKDDATFVGFPSDSGNGAVISGNTEYAIAEKSKVKEGAWEFLKSLIDEESQMPTMTKWGYYNYPNGLPILRAGLDKQAEIAMTKEEEDSVSSETEDGVIEDGVIIAPRSNTVSSDIAVALPETEDPYNRPLTQEEVDQIMALIEGTTQVMRNDTKLNSIITEEAAAYFEGQKTLEQTVDIIQNRASIYINESR